MMCSAGSADEINELIPGSAERLTGSAVCSAPKNNLNVDEELHNVDF